MKKLFSFLLAHFLLCLLCFLLIQKPLFLIFNWGYQDIPLSLGDLFDIYAHGFTIDIATAAYMTVIPLLLVWAYALLPVFSLKTWMKGYNVLMALLIAIGAVVDASLYTFWGFKLDKVIFYFIDDPKNAFASVSVGYLAFRLLLILLLVGSIWYILCLSTRFLAKEPMSRAGFKKVITVSTVMLLLGFVDFSMIRGWATRPKTPADVYYSSTYYFNHAALNPLYNLAYTSFKRDDFDKQFRYMSEEERQATVAEMFPVTSDSTMFILKDQRPNILLIIMEGMGACFVEALGGTYPVATNISDIMQHQSYWFSQAYAGSFQTDRGVVCAVSGYLGLPTVSIMRYTRKIRNLPGLARSLKEAGYDTQMLYSGDMTYVNFADYFIASGHDKLVGENDFSGEQRSNWGVPDHISFDWLYNDIQERQAKGHPWYISYLTLSSHPPFDVPYHKYADPRDNGFAYTDSCFGDFIHRLQQTPAWDNMLIACVADHGFKYSTLEDPAYPHIPLFFTGGAVARIGRDDRLVSQTDIPATILGQLGIPHDDFTYSRDVLSRSYQHPFAFTSYPNGLQYRDSTGVTVYNIITDQAVNNPDNEREHKAKAILQTIYDDISKR